MKNKPGRWKGCCMMCARFIRGENRHRTNVRELRAVGGRREQKHKSWAQFKAERAERED